MITCFLRYQINVEKRREFEDYARRWMKLVARFGGEHHGYFLPSEGANDVALALFSFASLAEYEAYRSESEADPECVAAYRFAEESGCIRSYERSFFRPLEDSATTNSVSPAAGIFDGVELRTGMHRAAELVGGFTPSWKRVR